MSSVPIDHYLVLASILFMIGAIGVLTRRSVLVILMSIQLMLSAASLTFLAFSRLHGDHQGHVMVLFVIAVGVAELAIGLAMVLRIFRHKRSVNIDDIRVQSS